MKNHLFQIMTSIIKENEIITRKTLEDPETGRVEWDVDYKTSLNKLYLGLIKLIDEFEQAAEEKKDPKLEDILQEFYTLKSDLHTYILRNRKK